MAFLALVVGERGVSFLPLLVVIILLLKEVNDKVPDTVEGLGIEKVDRVLRSWQMAVHAVGHETLLVVHVG